MAAALPTLDSQGSAGSILVNRPVVGALALALHVLLATVRQLDFDAPTTGALVLIDGLDRAVPPDARQVGSALGLTPALSRVALLLAEGKSVAEFAALSGRAETSFRTYVQRIYSKLGVSRRTDLVRMVLSVGERAAFRQSY